VLHCCAHLGIPDGCFKVNGGAIAIGDPLDVSGLNV
jgi:acetyl-CoA acetyltransferase